VVVLCLLVHWAAESRVHDIHETIHDACAAIQPADPDRATGFLDSSLAVCTDLLEWRHDYADADGFEDEFRAYDGPNALTAEELDQLLAEVERHYRDLAPVLPRFLQEEMAHEPPSLNPVPMLLSSFSHVDWWHVTGNLVFFVAFAVAVEAVLGSLLFIGAIVLLSVICGVAYSLFCVLTGSYAPTVGLSGVVMGIIGMAAFLMPRAPIHTVIGFGFLGWRFAVPAWLLAAWFIGWDIYSLFQGAMAATSTNFLSHVAGGVGGYLMARFALGEVRSRHQDEIDDAVEIAAITRSTRDPSLEREKISRRQLASEIREREARSERERFEGQLRRLVRRNDSSNAMLLLLEDYDLWKDSPEIYEELFGLVGEWKKGRAWMCLGRLCIELNVLQRRYGRAVRIAAELANERGQLHLADPDRTMLLKRHAASMNHDSVVAALTPGGVP
jgi:membrane associated rhomboid family serine protease